MLILHGSWLLSGTTDEDRGFVLWAETGQVEAEASRPNGDGRVRTHPLAASARALHRAVLDWLPSAEHIIKRDAKPSLAQVRLPSTRSAPQLSPGMVHVIDEHGDRKLRLAAWQVDALLIPPHAVPGLLMSLPALDDTTAEFKIGADLEFWRTATKFALELLALQSYTPTLVERDGVYLALWQPMLDEPKVRARLERLAKAMPPICRALSLSRESKKFAAPSPLGLLDDFMSGVVDGLARWHSVVRAHKFKSPRYLTSAAAPTTAEAWLDALNDHSPIVKGSTATLRAFYEQYHAWREAIPGAVGGEAFRTCFRLGPPPTPDGAEGIRAPKPDARDWTLQYLLQAKDDPSLLVPAETVWRERGSTLKFLNRKFDAPQERLLAGLGQASRMFAPIEASLRTARPENCALTAQEAYTFIRETALLLQSLGFGVLVPGLNSKLGVSVRLKPRQQTPKGGVAGLTFGSIVEYDWQMALGGEPLSREEFDKLAALKVPLVQIRGQWVEVRPDQIEQAIRFWEKRKGAGELSVQEALRLALSPELGHPIEGLPVTEVVAENWMGELLRELRRAEGPVPAATEGMRTVPGTGRVSRNAAPLPGGRTVLAGILAAVALGRMSRGRHGIGQDPTNYRAAAARTREPERAASASLDYLPDLGCKQLAARTGALWPRPARAGASRRRAQQIRSQRASRTA